MIGRAMANKTSGGTGVGPGAKRYRFNMNQSSLHQRVSVGVHEKEEAVRYH
jgi:hypothetical protein